MIIVTETQLQDCIGDLRSMFRAGPIEVKAKPASKRSLKQNGQSHVWYEQVSRELREDTPAGVKRFCKPHFGVPILRMESDEFRASYDAVFRNPANPMTYEQKLQAMDILPVTSLMTSDQKTRYLQAVKDHYWDKHRVDLRFIDEPPRWAGAA